MNKPSTFFQFEDNIISSVAQVYEKTEETLADDVQIIKKWMESQPHLPEILDDKSIQNFLILNKCSVERAKPKIDMYYTIRSRIPDLYEHINPRCTIMKEASNRVYCVPLPKLTKEIYRVIVFKFRTKDMIDQIDPYEILKLANNRQEIRLKEDVMFGDILIFDPEGITFKLFSKITPAFLMKVLAFYKGVYSIPVKSIYLVNSPPYFGTIVTMLKSMLKPKLFERIHVCTDTSILNKNISLEVLPRDYGGKEKSVEELFELWNLKFEQHQERFNVLEKLRVIEDLRPTKLENDEVLGYHGSFKKLCID